VPINKSVPFFEEERTDLYVSKSSLDAVSNPEATFQQWVKAVDNYGDSSDAALTFAIELLAAATAVVDGRSIDDIQFQQQKRGQIYFSPALLG
jgi:filamentous hemagglutinin